MRGVLFQWYGRKLFAYPAMLYFGILFGVLAGTWEAGHRGLDQVRAYIALLLLLPVALAGSRLLYVVCHWSLYSQHPRRVWGRSEGGAALYGGLTLAVLVSLGVLRFLRLPFWAFWDAATVTMLVGIVFGKVGCLLHGCCAGRPTTSRLGFQLPNARGVWCQRIPSQILEALLAVALLLASFGGWNRFLSSGVLFLCAVAAYACGRWWLESKREIVDRVGSLSLSRVASATLAGFSVVGLVLIRLHGHVVQ